MSADAKLSIPPDREPALKDGTCPRCGSDAVRSGAAIADKAGDLGANRIPINAKHSVDLDNYTCLACGYIESYIGDRAALQRIAAEWDRVPVRRSSSDSG